MFENRLIKTEIDSKANELIAILTKVSEAIGNAQNLKVSVVSDASLSELVNVAPVKLENAIKYYEDLLTWKEVYMKPFSEKELAQRALTALKMKVDDEFWVQYNENDIIEIYSSDMLQLYRSFNFFKVCGYSLLDLSVFEWFMLWERSPAIMKMMEEYCRQALLGQSRLIKVKIPKHLLREKIRSNMTEPYTPMAAIAEFRYIAPLTCPVDGHVKGFIVTSKGEPILESEIPDSIAFI